MGVVRFNSARATSGQRPKPSDDVRIITALDIGTSKICCLIAEAVTPRNDIEGAPAELRIRGFGHQASRGVRAGVVTDIAEADRAIRLTVDAAERMAGRTISEVMVAVSGGRPRCLTYTGETRIMGNDVGAVDMQRAISCALQKLDVGRRIVLHTAPVRYRLDDAHGVDEPLGMFGQTLAVEVNAVTVEPGPLSNLGLAVGRCHLDVAEYVMSPYAAARAVLVEDEKILGATYIEMGGGTTGIAAFHDGRLIFADVIPLGGQHITNDIARGLSTSLAHAERLKTLYGSALPAANDERDYLAVPLLGEKGVDKIHRVPRSVLTGIIRPRVEEILELVRDRIAASAFGTLARNRLVIGGGASQLSGIREVAGQILNRAVRSGAQGPNHAMPESARSPSFAVAAGLLDYALKPDRHLGFSGVEPTNPRANHYISRVGKWIKESF
jgi:cell division protein FtsA